MSQFNPDLFLSTETTDANDTKYIPLPIGEYIASVDSVNVKQNASKKDGTIYTFLELQWRVDLTQYPSEREEMGGMDSVKVKGSIILDLNDAGMVSAGPGKNVPLGKLREAVGQNKKGKPWNFNMLIGSVAKVKVSHRPDANDSDIVYPEVKAVTAA